MRVRAATCYCFTHAFPPPHLRALLPVPRQTRGCRLQHLYAALPVSGTHLLRRFRAHCVRLRLAGACLYLFNTGNIACTFARARRAVFLSSCACGRVAPPANTLLPR